MPQARPPRPLTREDSHNFRHETPLGQRLAERAATWLSALFPAVLVVVLALAGGGFDLPARHIAGIAAWLLVMVLIALGGFRREQVGTPVCLTAGAVAALVLLEALSATWSGAVERSLNEADRVLVYLGFLVAGFLLTQQAAHRRRFVQGLAVGLGIVALLAVFSRLFPDVIPPSESQVQIPVIRARLSYPLDYWNGTATMIGLSIPMLLWLGRSASSAVLRAFSVGALPAAILAIYFTYSRGGALAAVIAVACLIALSPHRLWYLSTTALAGAVTIPLFAAVQDRRELADGIQVHAAEQQGHTVFFFLLAAMLVSVVVHVWARRYFSRENRARTRLVELSRSPTVLRAAGLFAVVLVCVLAVGFGGRAWSKFTEPEVRFPTESEQRFTEVTGTGRYQMWKVALNGFDNHPLLGEGAGTYSFQWNRDRPINLVVEDAHSLYLESLAELGVVGLVLVLMVMFLPLVFGARALRKARGEECELILVCFAVGLAFAVAAAFDWLWEIAALGAVFFLAAGVMLAAVSDRASAGDRDDAAESGAFSLNVVTLALAWLSAAVLLGPLVAQEQIKVSEAAAERGSLDVAERRASSAQSIQPWAASPHRQLALVAEGKGNYREALAQLDKAIQRERRNWVLWVLRSRVNRAAGNRAGALADAQQARMLNPLGPIPGGQR